MTHGATATPALLTALALGGCALGGGGGGGGSAIGGAQGTAPPVLEPPPPADTHVVIAGEDVEIGAPVVTWQDEGGFDGYREACFFRPGQVEPTNPAPGCDTAERYAARRNLAPNLAATVAAYGWSVPLAACQVDQVVVHYDASWTSENCFRVLHDVRGLSCHFLLDVDGTLYQTLDVVERARHAGAANDRSIGIEIAHPGPLELTPALAEHYRRDAKGVRFDLGPRASQVRTPGFVVRPARPALVRGEVQGRVYTQYDFTDAQYETLARLLAALHRALPGIALRAPVDGQGRLVNRVLPDAEREAFRGVLGHFHVSRRKQDPGSAFDWARVLEAAKAHAAADAALPDGQ